MSHKAVSLPTSPHEFRSQNSERSGHVESYVDNDEMVSTWNKVLESPMFMNKPLLPFKEWHIEYSEIAVGTRVGIGNPYSSWQSENLTSCDIILSLMFLI